MKNKDVAEMFAEGKREGKAGSLFIDGNVVYSYGRHFPVAIRLWDGYEFKFIWNSDSYSRTTTRHQNMILRAIGGKDKILKEVNTQQMESYKKFNDVKEVMAEALD